MEKPHLLILLLISFSFCPIRAQVTGNQHKYVIDRSSPTIPTPIHGVTVADDKDIRNDKYLNDVIESLGNLTSGADSSPDIQVGGIRQRQRCQGRYICRRRRQSRREPTHFAEVVDSAYEFCFSVANHDARWNDYVSTLADYVDIWEIGNEINGNWLDKTQIQSRQRDRPAPGKFPTQPTETSSRK